MKNIESFTILQSVTKYEPASRLLY